MMEATTAVGSCVRCASIVCLFGVIGLLLACVTTSQVVPAGQDTYMISAANDTCGNCTPPQLRATERASAYCAKAGKTRVAKDSSESTFESIRRMVDKVHALTG